MSRKNQYDDDTMFEQPASGYYFPPMFRCPAEDDDREAMDMEIPGTGGSPHMQMHGGMPTPIPGTMPGPAGIPGEPYPLEPPLQNIAYTQAYLKSQIGKKVRVEFLIGNNMMTDKSGTLEEVGISYIIIRDFSGAKVLADLYSIKFVNIYG